MSFPAGSLKTEYLIYRAQNETTGLTDVVANVRLNGVSVSIGEPLSEVDSVNNPGTYELVMTPTMLTTWGGAGFYDFFVNSATTPAPAITSKWILANNDDDLEAQLNFISTAQGTTNTTVNSILSEVDNGTYGLSAIETLLSSVSSAVGSIQNNTMFSASVPAESIAPDTGSSNFRIPISVFDESGSMIDPDSQAIAVSITNQAGTDRSSYLVGYVAGPVNATYDGSAGSYHIDYSIPSGSPLEELIFKFSYAVASSPFIQRRVSTVVNTVTASGFALQTTLLAVKADIEDNTDGLVAINTNVEANNALLTNGTYGLSALETIVSGAADDTSDILTDTGLIKGTGFSTGHDSLHQLSLRIYTGGVAI